MNSPRGRILVRGVRKIVRNGGEHQRAVIDEFSALRLQRVECVDRCTQFFWTRFTHGPGSQIASSLTKLFDELPDRSCQKVSGKHRRREDQRRHGRQRRCQPGGKQIPSGYAGFSHARSLRIVVFAICFIYRCLWPGSRTLTLRMFAIRLRSLIGTRSSAMRAAWIATENSASSSNIWLTPSTACAELFLA